MLLPPNAVGAGAVGLNAGPAAAAEGVPLEAEPDAALVPALLLPLVPLLPLTLLVVTADEEPFPDAEEHADDFGGTKSILEVHVSTHTEFSSLGGFLPQQK